MQKQGIGWKNFSPQHRNFWFFIYSHPSTLNVIPSFVLLGITNNERMCGVTSF